MRTVKKSDVTYAQLETALRTLGFDVSSGANTFGFPYVRYENDTDDAIILIRGGAMDERLNAIDLLSAERTVEGRGVADLETFHRLLREAAQKEAQAA